MEQYARAQANAITGVAQVIAPILTGGPVDLGRDLERQRRAIAMARPSRFFGGNAPVEHEAPSRVIMRTVQLEGQATMYVSREDGLDKERVQREGGRAASRLLCVSGREAVRAATLANGMRVIVWPVRNIPNVALYNWVRAGSRNETPGATGLAHFFEHMMFNGTTRHPPGDFDRLMEAEGGANNAFTSDDVTVYQDWFPASALELVLDLESDRVAHLAFRPEVIESERGVVASERRLRVEDNSHGLLAEQVQASAFVAHPVPLSDDRLADGHSLVDAAGPAGVLPHLLRSKQPDTGAGGGCRTGARNRARPPLLRADSRAAAAATPCAPWSPSSSTSGGC